jgi:hypothetical protein
MTPKNFVFVLYHITVIACIIGVFVSVMSEKFDVRC